MMIFLAISLKMQRVVSGQTLNCIDTSEEIVSKRLCLSFVIVCAFFSIIGGYFLGRYTTHRANSMQCVDESSPYSSVLNSLEKSAKKIRKLTAPLSIFSSPQVINCSELHTNIYCDRDFISNNLSISDIMLSDLKRMDTYYYNISVLLESLVVNQSSAGTKIT